MRKAAPSKAVSKPKKAAAAKPASKPKKAAAANPASKPKKPSAAQPASKPGKVAAPKPASKSAKPASTGPASRPKKAAAAGSASSLIDAKIEELGGWRGAMLAKVRRIVLSADPEIVEELKWRGTPVWSRGGIVCTGETYKRVVKMTFARGAALEDPKKLFNSSLDGNVRRAIDIGEGEKIDEKALKDLVRAAIALNVEAKPKRR